jgi:4-diphosphocytidyl-2-C-methyl-D-erythritol kinase
LVGSDRTAASRCETAPAKINLTLTVHGRRADGYHELESVVAFAGAEVSDVLEFVPGGPFRLEVTGAGAMQLAGDAGGMNLVEKAVAAVLRTAPQATVGAFRLRKCLPIAAGIGGGSSDAAAALRLLRHANPDLKANIDWPRLAAAIGADVGVCLENKASLMSGLGERVAPLVSLPPVWAVIANPRIPLSTADVFRRLGAPPLADRGAGLAQPPVPDFPDLRSLVTYAADRPNDLEAPAKTLCPAIADVETALGSLDAALRARMSGSGPTSLALCATAEAASSGAGRLTARHPEWWVRATALH